MADTPAGTSDATSWRVSVANGAGGVVSWVNRRSWWVTGLLWLLLFWVLVPLWIVNRTGASRGGLIGAGAALLGLLLIGVVGGDPPDDTDDSRIAGPADTTGTDPDQSPPDSAPPPSPASPTATPSPAASTTLTPPPASPSDTPSPSPSPTATDDAETGPGPRGDDAPVLIQGRVVDVVDGDTLDLADGTRVRLAIADTPEVYGGVEPCAREAAAFAASFVAGETVAVYRPDDAPTYDPFDRLLGEVVRVVDGASLNVALVREGFATIDERFTSEDPDLARRLRTAAESAPTPACAEQPGRAPSPSDTDTSAGVVIASVRFDGPGNDVEVYNDSEYVELRNTTSTSIDIGGWAIVDAADNRVDIPDGYTIPAGATFRVYSGAGDDVSDLRYFDGRSQAYLNNSGGDRLELRDRSRTVADTYEYSS